MEVQWFNVVNGFKVRRLFVFKQNQKMISFLSKGKIMNQICFNQGDQIT